jgi:hypothetical protein
MSDVALYCTSLGRNNPVISYCQINRDIRWDYLIPLALSNTRKIEPMVGLHHHDNITKCYYYYINCVYILIGARLVPSSPT